MTDKTKLELAVGFFMVIGIGALIVLAMQVSNLSSFTGKKGYKVYANFEGIGGLKVRAPVMMAGVRIGEVSDVELDTSIFEARVTLLIDDKYKKLPKDTSASIFTSGLLGEQYISLVPGGDEEVLKEGDKIVLSQSAMVLEQVLGQFLFGKAAGND